MSDQQQANKPALSLEEELDVLEAVYRIGQKKGLDLLRPEQVKKLRDAGRMGLSVEFAPKTEELSKQEVLNGEYGDISSEELAEAGADQLISKIMDTFRDYIIKENSEDFWGNLTTEQKLTAINLRMYVSLGSSIQSMRYKIKSLLLGE
jgi:hypothetical protein